MKTITPQEQTEDLIEQGIDALIRAKKTTDPAKLQQIICILETIATLLRSIHE